jgi:predicted TIM-barrel fold metal-dependent hydrolase
MTDQKLDYQADLRNAQEVDRSIPFIETHHHLWELDRFDYDWLKDPGWEGHNADPVEETAWLESVANEYGFPHALVVFCDIEQADGEAQLARHLEASPRTRGIRIRAHPDDPDTAAFKAGYAALGKLSLSYELNASPGKLLSGRDVANAFPDIQVILGHAGFPVQRDDAYLQQWKSEMSALAEAPNVACKISGFAMVDHGWTIDSIRPWVLHCIEAFGVDRAMFGTNWPVDQPYSPYQVDAYRLIIAREGFSREDQEKMLYRNAERFYRI